MQMYYRYRCGRYDIEAVVTKRGGRNSHWTSDLQVKLLTSPGCQSKSPSLIY